MQQWYEIDGIEKLDSPALVIYPERVRENISTIVSMVGDADRLRPHVKTHKTVEASRMMMDAGVNKFKCATISEVEMLVRAGAPDILLAYQPVGPKVNRFADLIKKNPAVKFACLTDSRDAAAAMATIFSAAGLNVPVYLDINVGMNRTGIAPGPEALDLYRYCSSVEGIYPVGLHAYDGHQRSKNFEEREFLTNEGFEPVEEMSRVLTEEGFEEPILIAGGTPTFPVHAKKPNRICSPGTFVFWD